MQTQVEDKRETNTVSIGAGNAPFIINGCTISFNADADNSKKTLLAVKEILLSANRTRTTDRQ